MPDSGAASKPAAALLDSLDAAASMVAALKQRRAVIDSIADVAAAALKSGHKALTCGNGGSAAEALHMAEELVGRFHARRRPLPAVCLCADAAALTCIANDWEYSEAFARQVEAHGRPGDVLIALSTSGQSPSILRALERARAIGVVAIGLLGPAGSPAERLCRHCLTLDGLAAARVQEAHLIVIHLILERIDAEFAGGIAPA